MRDEMPGRILLPWKVTEIETDYLTGFCLEGQRHGWLEDELAREMRFCAFVHDKRYLLQVRLAGRSSFTIHAAPIFINVVDCIRERDTVPWQTYDQTIVSVTQMIRHEFAGRQYAVGSPDDQKDSAAEHAERPIPTILVRRYGQTIVDCTVLAAATVTAAKLRPFFVVAHDNTTERRVYVAEPYRNEAKGLLENMKQSCTLLAYEFDTKGQFKIMQRELI